jgi:hypothetical protein
MNAAMPASPQRIIRPSKAATVLVFIVFVGGPAILGMLMIHGALRQPAAGARAFLGIMAVPFLASVLLGLFHISARVELTPTSIVRRSMFGARRLPMSDIVSALRRLGGKGTIFLTVRTVSDRMTFSNLNFSDVQLHEMQDFIQQCASASSRSIQVVSPPNPRISTGLAVYFAVVVAVAALLLFAVAVLKKHHGSPDPAVHAIGMVPK